MKLSELIENTYGGDDETVDGGESASEVGNIARRDAQRKVSMAGRGANYKKANQIAGRAKLAKSNPIISGDDNPAQHGPNFSSMNFRR